MGATSLSGTGADTRRLIAALRRDEPMEPRSQGGSDQAAAGGTAPNFDTVIRLFHKRVYNLVYRLLGNSDEAADLTQETFVKAYGAYRRFQGNSDSVFPWLCRIAVNGCKNKFRELGRKGRYEVLSLDEPVGVDESPVTLEIGDESSNPAGVYERRELEAKIQEAVQALQPEFRIVVVLRDMQGLSYREVADATGLTLETVKARLFRGRGMIRRRLSAYLGG